MVEKNVYALKEKYYFQKLNFFFSSLGIRNTLEM